MKKRIKEILEILTLPMAVNPDTALMEYMTKMILLVISLVTIPSALFSVIGWHLGFIPADTLIILCLMNILFVIGWMIANKGYWRLSSLIPPSILFFAAVYGNFIGGIDAPAMLIYVLAILLVAVLRGERDMFIVFIISLSAYLIIGLGHKLGYITHHRSAETAFWNRVIITCTTIISISMLLRFLIIQYRQALNQARTEINERRSIEAALRDSERNYRELVQNSNSIILRINKYGEVTFCNEFAERFFGYSYSELIGKNVVGTIVPETDTSGKDLKQMMKNVLNTPDDYRANENENMTRDGSRVWVTWANKPVIDNEGNFIELLCIGNDITKQKTALEEKEKIHTQLIQAQKMEAIGTLTSGLAHDFNNILGGIMGSLSLLKLLLAEEDIHERDKSEKYLQIALDSSARATDMIKQLLLLSRKHELSLKPADMNESMKHVITICANSFPKSVAINASYGERPMIVLTDSILIEQIFLNFCVNASHAMTIMRKPESKEGGELTVRISSCKNAGHGSSETHQKESDYIKIEISDSGIGMDNETQKRIFEPFFTMKNKGSGTGLGLSMAYGFINRLGGFIEIDSTVEQGSTFRIYLPEYTGGTQDAEPKEAGGGLVSGNETILIIDDETELLSIACDILVSCGYRVLKANDAIKGLDIYRENSDKIDAVLLDISMPHMSGLEVFKKIKAISREAKVLLSSGYSEDDRIAEAMSGGADGFIAKPYTAENLSRSIHEILKVYKPAFYR